MRLHSIFINLIAGLFLTSQTSVILADETLVARFSTSNVKPWGFFNEEGVPSGLLVELAHALEDELAITSDKPIIIDNQFRPYPRVIHEIEKGIVDFAVMFISPEANKLGISVGKVADSKVILVGRTGTPTINDINELEGKLIGHIRGSKYGKRFDNNKLINKISFISMEQGISMLLKGRIYALASADQTLYYALKERQISNDKVVPIMTISQISTALYFSKASKRTALIPPLTEALSRLRSKGILNTIFHPEEFVPKKPKLLQTPTRND